MSNINIHTVQYRDTGVPRSYFSRKNAVFFVDSGGIIEGDDGVIKRGDGIIGRDEIIDIDGVINSVGIIQGIEEVE